MTSYNLFEGLKMFFFRIPCFGGAFLSWKPSFPSPSPFCGGGKDCGPLPGRTDQEGQGRRGSGERNQRCETNWLEANMVGFFVEPYGCNFLEIINETILYFYDLLLVR